MYLTAKVRSNSPPPRSSSIQKLAGILFLALSACAFTSCGEPTKSEDADAKAPSGPRTVALSAEALKKIDLKTDSVAERPVAVPLHLTGRIEPDVHKEVNLSTRIAGRITDIDVTPGQAVRAGQTIAKLDSSEVSDLESELLESGSKLKIAELQVERERQIFDEHVLRPTALITARAHFKEAKVQLKVAETEFNRAKDLHAEKILAVKDFVQAEAKLAQAHTQFDEAQANFQREEHLYQNRAMLKRDYQLALAEAERIRNHVNTLKQRLVFLGVDKPTLDEVTNKGKISGEINLVAPIGGVVTFREVAIGQVAQPSITLFTVSDMSTVLIQVDLPEIDVRKVKLGDKVKAKIPSYPDEIFEGKIDYIGVGVHADTRTVSTRARLSNPSGRLKKFMFAEIMLEGSPNKVLACPKDAIQQHGEQKIVFAQTKDGFVERPITTGIEGDKYVEVLTGLKSGDVVATQGSLMLKNEITFRHSDD